MDKNAPKNEKLEAYNTQSKRLKQSFNLKINSNNQSEIDSLLQELTENLNEGQELGLSFNELFNPDVQEALKNIISKGYNISEFTKFGKDSGYDIDKILGPDYSEILSTQMQKGYDVNDFLEWTILSETKIAKESWDDAADYIQKRIDDGFNVEKLIEKGEEAGIDWGEAFKDGYTEMIQEYINKGFDPTNLIKLFTETDEKAAKDFRKNYKTIAHDMLDFQDPDDPVKKMNPAYMLINLAKTDKEFADEFRKNGIDVIQKMLDKGFDFTSILDGFGLTVNEMFDVYDKNFHKKIQNLFNKDFSTSFFQWADKNDIKYEKLMGENMQKYMNQYEWQQGIKSGEYKINSAGDAKLYNYGKATKFATGGYISAGNSGIIAEAGPELIEVMNGGARITPMREKARNTEVSDSTAGQKIFYNTYNLNNPRISNDMDIRQIAQKLAVEQRRIEKGRGIF